jgi:hypothetical protein
MAGGRFEPEEAVTDQAPEGVAEWLKVPVLKSENAVGRSNNA